MIIDSSALVAIVFAENDAPALAQAIKNSPQRRVSAASFLETALVVEGRSGAKGGQLFDLFIARSKISIENVTAEQAMIARQAWRDFGKGSGHPARLNFGDCFAYALARITGEPLLCKGNDLSSTDIHLVKYSIR